MLKRNDPQPLYIQLQEIIEDKIASGEWIENQLIPSENEMSRIYGISRMTSRAVILELVREGLLYRVQGKGTFVATKKIETKPLSYAGIREQLEEMGYSISTKLVKIEKRSASRETAEKLGIEHGNQIISIERLRYIKDEPLSYHVSYVPEKMCVGLEAYDLEGEQLCHILTDNYDLTRERIIETLESVAASDYIAKALNVKEGSHLLLLEDVIYSKSKSPFEYSRVYFRGDKIKLRFEFGAED